MRLVSVVFCLSLIFKYNAVYMLSVFVVFVFIQNVRV